MPGPKFDALRRKPDRTSQVHGVEALVRTPDDDQPVPAVP